MRYIFNFAVAGIMVGSGEQVHVEVYFIRHAKSVWNDAQDPLSETNSRPRTPTVDDSSSSRSSRSSSLSGGDQPGPPSSPINGARPVSPVQYFTGTLNSWKNIAVGYMRGKFYDANLSASGIEQAKRLADWMENRCPAIYDISAQIPDACILNRPIPGTALFVSNLKRTRETMLTGLQYRFNHAFFEVNKEEQPSESFIFETINVMNELQERECHQDARLDPKNMPELDKECPEGTVCPWKFDIVESFRGSGKVLLDVCGVPNLMNTHPDYERPGSTIGETLTFTRVIYEFFKKFKFRARERMIVVGHSNWLRRFFVNRLMDFDELGEQLKRNRIANTAIVKFNIVAEKNFSGMIDIDSAKIEPGTIRIVYDPSRDSSVSGTLSPSSLPSSSPQSLFDQSLDEFDRYEEAVESAAKKEEVRNEAIRQLLRSESTRSENSQV